MYKSGINVVYARFVSDSGFAGVGFKAIYSTGKILNYNYSHDVQKWYQRRLY